MKFWTDIKEGKWVVFSYPLNVESDTKTNATAIKEYVSKLDFDNGLKERKLLQIANETSLENSECL